MPRRNRGSRGAAPACAPRPRLHWGLVAGLCVGFTAASLLIAAPAVDGTFLSDDYVYIVNNPYVHGVNPENVRVLLDPWGPPTIYTNNYAPVHLLLHALQWQFFGEATRGYHLVNAVLHALTSVLLIAFFVRSGIPTRAAVLGGAIFLLHPANVEVVAWIFQLKTILALALALGALLLHERRPALATALFALAILTKVTAAFALPVALVQAWVRSRSGEGTRARWIWLGVWGAVLLLLMVPEMSAFRRQGDVRILIHEDSFVHGRTVVAIGMRYLVMAASGEGVSTFHEPPPALSALDPWWLAGVASLSLLAWRTLSTLRRRDEEAAYWVFAASSFVPVSQIFPFIFPMGDRYLYAILPGLIGGLLLAGHSALKRLDRALGAPRGRKRGGPSLGTRVAGLVGIAWVVVFAGQSHERAGVFRSMTTMMTDAALNYPDGMQAHLLRGHRAAREGDVRAAALAFQRAVDLGFSDLAALLEHRELAQLRREPAFRQVLRNLAAREIARLSQHDDPEQSELARLAGAYWVRGESGEAIRTLERALRQEGPFEEDVRALLRVYRQREGLDRNADPPDSD
jgi:tetratricopeptide (TPR) repeat protein